MRGVTLGRSATVVWVILAASSPAAAQQTGLTVSSGYQDMVYTIAQNEDPLPPGFVWVCPDPRRGCQFVSGSYSVHGAYFDVAAQITPTIVVVGEWQWNESKTAGLLGGDPEGEFPGLKVSIQQFVGGLRLSGTRRRLVPFAQALVGGARVSSTVPGISESESVADLRIGVGIDMMFSDHVGLRGSGGYTHLFSSRVRRNDLAQFGVGMVFRR